MSFRSVLSSPLPLALTLLSAAGLGLLTLAAQAAPPPAPLAFTVLRDGSEVGSHTLRFRADGADTDVSVDTAVVVRIAMVPVYRFEHHGKEHWQGDRLQTLTSETNDDGTHHTVAAQATGADLAVTGDGTLSHQQAATLPASLWSERAMTRTTLMNTLDGHLMTVSVQDLGQEAVQARGQTVAAHHYRVSGDLQRDVWYDPQGLLVQMRFKAKDDSDIRYVLK